MSEVFEQALELQRVAAQAGFDWSDPSGLWDKLQEEIGELREAADAAARLEELGDLLFMVTNLARHLELNPRAALAAANAKFERRFGYIMARSAGLPAPGDGRRLAAMEALWIAAKRAETLTPPWV